MLLTVARDGTNKSRRSRHLRLFANTIVGPGDAAARRQTGKIRLYRVDDGSAATGKARMEGFDYAVCGTGGMLGCRIRSMCLVFAAVGFFDLSASYKYGRVHRGSEDP